MADQWYVNKGGKKHGPFSTDQLKKLAASGKIDSADLLWKGGMEKWVTCGSAKGLFSAAQTAHAAPPPPPPSANPLDDFDAGHPAAAFADFEVPAYVPTPEEPPPIKPAETATASYAPIKAASRSAEPAGVFVRAVALLIDGFVFLIPVLITTLVLVASIDVRSDPRKAATRIALLQVITNVGVIAYNTLMESSRSGATLGKRAMGIRVTDLEGRRIGVARALGRNVAKPFSSIFMIGFIIAFFTPRKQAAHDLVAGTVVVKA